MHATSPDQSITHSDFKNSFFQRSALSFIGVAYVKRTINDALRVGIGPPPAAKGLDDVDESAVVLDPPLGAPRLLLLLLLGVHLGRLAADLAGTGEGAVNL